MTIHQSLEKMPAPYSKLHDKEAAGTIQTTRDKFITKEKQSL